MKTARFIPKVTEWASALRPALDAIPMNPSNRTGQHQLPTKAGTDKTIHPTDTKTPLLPPSAPEELTGRGLAGRDQDITRSEREYIIRERKKNNCLVMLQ